MTQCSNFRDDVCTNVRTVINLKHVYGHLCFTLITYYYCCCFSISNRSNTRYSCLMKLIDYQSLHAEPNHFCLSVFLKRSTQKNQNQKRFPVHHYYDILYLHALRIGTVRPFVGPRWPTGRVCISLNTRHGALRSKGAHSSITGKKYNACCVDCAQTSRVAFFYKTNSVEPMQ